MNEIWLKEQALTPCWVNKNRVHNWRNYISDKVKKMWDTFTLEQKIALVEQADEQADKEEWD